MSAPRVLITAGQVYGMLDDNKLVGNRVRGIWATKLSRWLAEQGYAVTVLIPDTMAGTTAELLDGLPREAVLNVVKQRGYHDYARKCEELAPQHDAAVMAAAVVNWIPEKPIPGKMPTKGYNEGDILNIPFVLAPRVINRMRQWNPKLTLIGCKMLIGAEPEELIDAAYHVILTAKCNAVVANDMGHGLRTKKLVFPDRTVMSYDDDFDGFFEAIRAIVDDQHWHSEELSEWDFDQRAIRFETWNSTVQTFDAIINTYRERFSPRGDGKVFGSLLVRGPGAFLVSPREKEGLFTSNNAVLVQNIDPKRRTVLLARREPDDGPPPRATMNAPLLVRMWQQFRPAAVLHLHEQLPEVPTVPYAPPGTDRDNLRDIPGPAFNIEGHGFVACVNSTGEILKEGF